MKINEQRITVFLSCTQEDSARLNAVKNRLASVCRDKVDVDFVQFDYLHNYEDKNKEVSRLINRCDIFFPIITPSWFDSLNMRDELVRAHERRRYIFPLIFEDEVKNHLDKLPYFVKSAFYIKTIEDNRDEIYGKIARELENFKDFWNNKYFEEIRKIGDAIKSIEHPHHRLKEYAFQETNILRGDLEHLFNNSGVSNFRKNVSYESNFLSQANPFFKWATKIFAVSIVKISSFWTSESMRDAVISYLRKQSEGQKPVYRLFVFDTPDEANQFKNILEANYSHYGKANGGIFICSYETYKNTLRAFDTDISKDFGILQYIDNEDQEIYFKTTFDTKEFVIYKINIENEIAYKRFITSLEEFAKLGEGEVNPYGILKWSPRFAKPEMYREWATVLNEVFKYRDGQVTHLVLIKANEQRDVVYNKLLDIKEKFAQRKDRHFEIQSFDVLSFINVRGIDGRYNAILNMNNDFDFVIIETFLDETSLRLYYSHTMHSEQRQLLYEILNPSIKEQYHLLTQTSNEKEKSAIFNNIEALMKDYILRIDFRDDTSFEYIAQQKGIEWEKFKA